MTTKTGAEVHFDLTLCPMVMEKLSRVPLARRTGSTIIDENADPSRPYAEHAYYREWGAIADSAGCRVGCSTLMRELAGRPRIATRADFGDISPSMGHARPETTVRYIRGKKLETTRRVAPARVAHSEKTAFLMSCRPH